MQVFTRNKENNTGYLIASRLNDDCYYVFLEEKNVIYKITEKGKLGSVYYLKEDETDVVKVIKKIYFFYHELSPTAKIPPNICEIKREDILLWIKELDFIKYGFSFDSNFSMVFEHDKVPEHLKSFLEEKIQPATGLIFTSMITEKNNSALDYQNICRDEHNENYQFNYDVFKKETLRQSSFSQCLFLNKKNKTPKIINPKLIDYLAKIIDNIIDIGDGILSGDFLLLDTHPAYESGIIFYRFKFYTH